jgi:hypothetical protein
MPSRHQLSITSHAGLSERLFVWTELALSGLLRGLSKVRRPPR